MTGKKRCVHCHFNLPPTDFYARATNKFKPGYVVGTCKLCSSFQWMLKKRVPHLDRRVVKKLCQMAQAHKNGGGDD